MKSTGSMSLSWLIAGLVIGAALSVVPHNTLVVANLSTALVSNAGQSEVSQGSSSYMYVFDQFGRVWLVDPGSNLPLAPVQLGREIGSVHGITSKDNSRAYLTSSTATGNSLVIMQLPFLIPIGEVPLEEPPMHAALAPDEKWLYVVTPHSINIVSTLSGALVASLESEEARYADVAFSIDGRLFFVSDEARKTIVWGDTEKREIVAATPLDAVPTHLLSSPSGKQLFIALRDGHVAILDLETRSVQAKVLVEANHHLHGLMLSHGTHLFVADVDGNAVAVINVESRSLEAKIEVGRKPILVFRSPVGQLLYVVNSDDDHISVISEKDHKVVGQISLAFPQDMIFMITGSMVKLPPPSDSQDKQRRPPSCSF